jgi:UDP-2,3-diacylglucosamine pyrophosphatase LpxH
MTEATPMHYKTVWISDLHLGTRNCNARGALEFLRRARCETLYLVGDVVDVWALRRSHYWHQTHNDVMQQLLRKARKGTRVIYIPGNHDEFSRDFFGVYGNITVQPYDIYTSLRGERLLVLHGHEFDTVTVHAKWLSVLGDVGYTLLLQANKPLNGARRWLGLPEWSLSAFVKRKVKNAVGYIGNFEQAVVRYAEKYETHGVVCGHIHTPAMKKIRHVSYYNTGDWVESSTALVEHFDGRLEILRWREIERAIATAEAEPMATEEAFEQPASRILEARFGGDRFSGRRKR